MPKGGVGICNLETKRFIKNSANSDLESNFAGVYPSNKISFFCQLLQSDWKKRLKVPFDDDDDDDDDDDNDELFL